MRYKLFSFVLILFSVVLFVSCGKTSGTEDPPPSSAKELAFELNEDKTSYAVSSLGSITDTDIVIPETYNGMSVTAIAPSAFKDCKQLTGISIPESITYIGPFAFQGCDSLIEKEAGVSYVDKWVVACDNTTTNVVLRNDTFGIAYGAFEKCHSLTDISIPEGLTIICDWAFSDCSALTSITMGNRVTSIGYGAFHECSELVSIELSSGLSYIGAYAFDECRNLESIKIPDGVTSIKEGTFSWCCALSNVALPNGLQEIGSSTFKKCYSLSSITIPASTKTVGENAFEGCKNGLIIYTDIQTQPDGWHSNWNPLGCTVAWGQASEN